MGWAELIQRSEVCSTRTFAEFAAQEAGIPYPAKTHLYAAEKLVKELFAQYPALTWQSLCGLVDWAVAKERRYPHILQLLNAYRYAYADGFIKDVDVNSNSSLDARIKEILETETDPAWVDRLSKSKGPGRKVVIAAWEKGIQL